MAEGMDGQRGLLADPGSAGFVRRLLELARDEDLGVPMHDATGEADPGGDEGVRASLDFRQAGIVCGLALVPMLLEVFACGGVVVERAVEDGSLVNAESSALTMRGPRREVVRVERTLLNLVGRLSGVATLTRRYVEQVRGTKASILDTRKTTPGLRVLEKYAVRCGGGVNHRMGLHDALLVKDNHLAGVATGALAGHLSAFIERARARSPRELAFVQVEVDSLEQFGAVLGAGEIGVDLVLLDNMSVESLRSAVEMRERAGSRVALEASGGVRLETVRAIAQTGVERISVGALTHQAQTIDVGLTVWREG